jgi:voltage-gated potassium channel
MTGEQQDHPLHTSSQIRFEDLVPDIRRRMVFFSAIRSILFAAVIVAAYFTLPFNRSMSAGPITGVVVGMVVVATTLALQIRATMRSPFPGMRAVESLALSGPLFLILFATTHYLIGHNDAHSYSQAMTRLDALYFTLTVFTTVGFGDIAPVSELARTVTMLQMIGDVLLIFVIARVLFGAVKVGIQRRTRLTSTPPPLHADAAGQSPEPYPGPDG